MSSPVVSPFLSFIHIDRKSSTAVYLQIVHQCIHAIQRGILPKGTRLPGTRVLGGVLGVHRKTMVAAYEELEAQGWVVVWPNKGTFVMGNAMPTSPKKQLKDSKKVYHYPTSTGFNFATSNLLDFPDAAEVHSFSFNEGEADPRELLLKEMAKNYATQLKRKNWEIRLNQSTIGGSIYLKKQWAQYLNLSRGLHIGPDQLLMTRSKELSIYTASKVILQPKDIVVVGELSYYEMNMIFQDHGAQLMTVPVDEQGLVIDELRKLTEQHTIRMLYINAHHHYPSTVSLSAERRLQLIELAKEKKFVIFEDDFDFDLDFDNHPMLPLASADHEGMVVYFGNLGQTFAPNFRMSFAVAPTNLIREMQKNIALLDSQGDMFMEYTLGEMIEEGDFHRYLKKTVQTYKTRRIAFATLLNQYMADEVNYRLPSGGFAFWITWKNPINLMHLRTLCAQNKLYIPQTLLFQNKQITAMRLGFAHFNTQEMEQALQILATSCATLRAKTKDE